MPTGPSPARPWGPDLARRLRAPRPQPEEDFFWDAGQEQGACARQGALDVTHPRRRQERQELLSVEIDEGPRQLREPAAGREVNCRHFRAGERKRGGWDLSHERSPTTRRLG